MNRAIVVTGTDTGVGKTIFATALANALGAHYWKPIQAGLADGSDSEVVASLGVIVLPEAYRLTTPCSPDRAAEIDGVAINPDRLILSPSPLGVSGRPCPRHGLDSAGRCPPDTGLGWGLSASDMARGEAPPPTPPLKGRGEKSDLPYLIIEGAGGVLVPVTCDLLFADLFARWGHPVVLVARTTLGTINHSLMSIEALRARGVPILGVAFTGDPVEHSEATIARIGGVRRLGRLPHLQQLDAATLHAAFTTHFNLADFA